MICPKCNKNLFNEFIPGSPDSPGKLLDMCRALHAEETALLQLNKNGKYHNNLILYSTTQPCNLCSNKIVSSGIHEVVFDEPYSMKEALDTLIQGNVNPRRFEGVKSSAYFRLYK